VKWCLQAEIRFQRKEFANLWFGTSRGREFETMFEMRPEHVRAFEAAQLKGFEDRALMHMRRTLPKETEGITDDQLRARFRREMPKSQSYGLGTERQILWFLDSGLMLGEGFDRDPHLPWVRELLVESKEDPETRAQKLVVKAAHAAGYQVVR
jgi:hypothetical protein